MSGIFSGIGTLQFTPDNKYAQYFNNASFDNNETTIGEFTINSEYLLCKIQTGVDNYDGADLDVRVLLNDEQILLNRSAVTGRQDQFFGQPLQIFMPPFSTIKLTMQNKSNSSAFTGSMIVFSTVGMPQRVGN